MAPLSLSAAQLTLFILFISLGAGWFLKDDLLLVLHFTLLILLCSSHVSFTLAKVAFAASSCQQPTHFNLKQ